MKLKKNLNSIITMALCLFSFYSLVGQNHLDVEGDTEINGRLTIIQTQTDSSIHIGAFAGFNDPGINEKNIFIGQYAGQNNLNGSNNVFLGNTAGQNNLSGQFNTFIGGNAGAGNVTGSNNVFIGYVAGLSNSGGGANTYVGRFAGQNVLSSSFCTYLGYDTGQSNTSLSFTNSMALGNGAKVDGNNTIVLGNTNITSIKGQVNFTTFSDMRLKQNVKQDIPGLDFVLLLNPVTYELKNRESNKHRQTGFIAQEVEISANQIGYDFSGVDYPQTPDDNYGIRYSEFVVPLTKAIQEQQEMINELMTELKDVKAELNEMKKVRTSK